MSENPSPPESKPIPDTSSKTRKHNYAEYIDKSLQYLKRLEPKYDKSIFDIKQEQDQVYSELKSVDYVAEVNPPIPESPTAGPSDIFGRDKLIINEAVDAEAAAVAKAAQQEFLKELKQEQYQQKLTEIISSMKNLAVEAEKIDGSEIQKQITNIQSITNLKSIENLPGLGYNEHTIEFLRQKYMELMKQYEAQVKKIEESTRNVEAEQERREEERNESIKNILEKLHNLLANAAASKGGSYNIAVLWEGDDTADIVGPLRERINAIKAAIEADKERMIKEQKDKADEDLKNIEENFQKLRREVEELNVVKENGKKIQEAIEKNYENLSETKKKIIDINVKPKLDELMEKSDEMERAIKKRIEQIEEDEYSIDEEKKVQKAIKECNNEYFLNLRNATVNHIKLTIEKLKGEGIKNIKNEHIKAKIYGKIKNGRNKSTDFYLFLNIVDFLLFMINPPEYKKKDKKLNYKNLKTSFYNKGINKIINKEAEKLENVQMLFGFIERRRYLRDIDENWLCENINS